MDPLIPNNIGETKILTVYSDDKYLESKYGNRPGLFCQESTVKKMNTLFNITTYMKKVSSKKIPVEMTPVGPRKIDVEVRTTDGHKDGIYDKWSLVTTLFGLDDRLVENGKVFVPRSTLNFMDIEESSVILKPIYPYNIDTQKIYPCF